MALCSEADIAAPEWPADAGELVIFGAAPARSSFKI